MLITEYIEYSSESMKWSFDDNYTIDVEIKWANSLEGVYNSLGTTTNVAIFNSSSTIDANLPTPSSDDLGITTQVVEATNDNGDIIYVIENKYIANEGILDGTYTITTTIDIEDSSVTSGIQIFTDVIVVENGTIASTTRQNSVVINITEFGVVDENNYFVPNEGIVIESTEEVSLIDENYIVIDLGTAKKEVDNIIDINNPAPVDIAPSGLSIGAIIGIIIGVIVGVGLIGGGIWFGINKRRI